LPIFDIVITVIANFAIGLLFLLACFAKVTNFAVFKATLDEYNIVPKFFVGLCAVIIVGVELAIGVGAFFVESTVGAMLAAAMLLSCYSAAIGINLLRGRRDIDCGCTGPASRQMLSGWLLVRNVVLASIAVVGAAPYTARELQPQDWALVGLALIAAMSLYAAINQLMANVPRLDALDSIMETG